MNFSQAHLDFLNYLEVIKNKSPKTSEQYDRHLNKFWEFLEEKNIDRFKFEMQNMTLDLAEWFRTFLYKKGKRISVKTANAYMITLRAFLKFLEKKWIKSISPTSIDLMKQDARMVEFLNREELERLFDAPNKNTLIWTRDLAIIKMIYSTWLRISELTALNVSDVNLTRKEFAVRWKWKKVRVVYLTDDSADSIKKYLEKRKDHLKPLFIRHNTKTDSIDILEDEKMRLTRFFITTMVKEYAKKAFILKDISAHTLRHSFATTLLNNWAWLREIQELLWHSSINTTQVYTHVTNPKLKETHRKFMK